MSKCLLGVRGQALALLAALALALGAVACGSDDDDGGGGAGATAAQGGGGDGGADAGEGPSSVKDEVRDAYDGHVDDLRAQRWQQTCDRYTADYAQAYAEQVDLPGTDTCAASLRRMFADVGVQPRPWLGKVEIEDAETAIGESKLREDNPGIRLRFVKQGGEWKLDGPADRDRRGDGP